MPKPDDFCYLLGVGTDKPDVNDLLCIDGAVCLFTTKERADDFADSFEPTGKGELEILRGRWAETIRTLKSHGRITRAIINPEPGGVMISVPLVEPE